MATPRMVELETLAGHKLVVDAKSVVDIQEGAGGRAVARITRQERDQAGYLVVLKGSAEEARKIVAGES